MWLVRFMGVWRLGGGLRRVAVRVIFTEVPAPSYGERKWNADELD